MLLLRLFFLFVLFLSTQKVFADFAYVANFNANSVTVIDTSTNSVVTTIPAVGVQPSAIAITPNGKNAYVTNFGDSSVIVIDTASNTVVDGPIPVGSFPAFLAITPNGAFVYVTNVLSLVDVISTSSNTVTSMVNVINPQNTGISITPDGKFAYVNSSNGNVVNVIDLSNNMVKSGAGYPIPMQGTGVNDSAISVGPNGSFAYIVNTSTNNVDVIDITSDSVLMGAGFPIPVGVGPEGLSVTPDNQFVYLANVGSSTVSVISTQSNSVVQTIPIPMAPFDVAITPDGKFAYVTTVGGFVYVIDIATNTVDPTIMIPIPVGVATIAITPASRGVVQGKQIRNRFLTQTDFVNIISWTVPSFFITVKYQIFRNGILVSEKPVSHPSFEDHNRKKGETYTYTIVALNAQGNTLTVGNVVVPPV